MIYPEDLNIASGYHVNNLHNNYTHEAREAKSVRCNNVIGSSDTEGIK